MFVLQLSCTNGNDRSNQQDSKLTQQGSSNNALHAFSEIDSIRDAGILNSTFLDKNILNWLYINPSILSSLDCITLKKRNRKTYIKIGLCFNGSDNNIIPLFSQFIY